MNLERDGGGKLGIDGVCVIIAAYNARDTIGRAVRSAIPQPGVAKVLVIDDASADETADVAQAAANGSDKLQVIRLQENGGPARARNVALDQSNHPFFAILDADDEFANNRFEDMPASDWDFFGDNMLFLSEDAETTSDIVVRPKSESGLTRKLGFEEFLESNIDHHSKKTPELGFIKPVIRRETIERHSLRYDERLRLGEDYLFYARALAKGAEAVLSDRTGYIAHVRSTSLSRRHRLADLENLSAADDDFIAELREAGAPEHWLELVRQHQILLRQKIEVRSFLDKKNASGVIRTCLGQISRPLRLSQILLEIVRDRGRHRNAVEQTKRLFDESHFLTDAS